MRAWLVVACALGGCGIDVGETTEWIASETIEGTELGPPPSSIEAAPHTLRVVTYNVDMGGSPDLAADILGNAALASADVYLVQEEEFYPTEGTTRASRLAAQLGTSWVYVPGRPKNSGTHGLAIFSRYPIESVERMTLPRMDNWKPRIAIRAEIVVGAHRIPVVDMHLETRINITDRILQIRPAILDLPEQVIVAGDMNTNPFLWEDGSVPIVPTGQIAPVDQAPVLDAYVRGLGFATPAADAGPTESHLGIESRLDAIFVRGLATTTATVERTVGASDHWPVWVDVTLP